MKAMLLAAGRGERMRPLTDHTPKPLLPVGGKPLIVWHLEKLAAAGVRDVVINHAWLGEQIEQTLGNGEKWGLTLTYSPEPPGALETAGGIAKALPLLGEQPFLVISSDIFCDADFAQFTRSPLATGGTRLLLTGNPPHHPHGDFSLDGGRVTAANGEQTLTYTGIGLFPPALFRDVPPNQPMKLRPLLDAAIRQGIVTGERHAGYWADVGTPERLVQIDQELQTAPL
ncbi:MAG: nucleotidyltransferase family protein [Azonexus sp.]|jgi:MurNAc alpha-1-phosphate uridylyltransferase|nr:nucleotidyltransferase family protein [Azonexus sp.]